MPIEPAARNRLLELQRLKRLTVQLIDIDAVTIHHRRLDLEGANQLQRIEEVVGCLLLRHHHAHNAVDIRWLTVAA